MSDDRGTPYYLKGVPIPDTPRPGETPAPWGTTHTVGKPHPRVDAYERVSGTAVYPSDVVLPDMLYGAILGSPHANARITRVNADRARAMPGVFAVLTAADPEADRPWFYWGPVPSRLFDPACRFEGDAVAAVAARTPYEARDAAQAIEVTYEPLPFVSDHDDALRDGAPLVHDYGNRVQPDETYARGDVDAGFAAADVVLERTFRTPAELHVPMELHGCVARWDGDALTLWESTQGVYAVQSEVAEALAVPLSKIRVIGHYMGGGFGSKLQAGKYSVIAALLARKTGRPVKLFHPREETLLVVGNRPPATMILRAGARRDGTLTALEFTATGASGAFPAGGAMLLDWLVRDLYTCPNVRTRGADVYVNAGPARPMRAPGHPQGAWALEQVMDALAEAVGMDPLAFRLRNIPDVSQARGGSPYTSTGLRQCLVEGAKAFGWTEARARTAVQPDGPVRRGVGLASCLWVAGGGEPPSTVILKLFADGSVDLNFGASDIGTGTNTIMALTVAEELGIDPAVVRIEHADTGTTQFATPSGGSKTVPTETPAARAAAVSVKQQLLDIAAEELETEPASLVIRDGRVVDRNDPAKGAAVAALNGLRRRGVIVGLGYRGPNPSEKTVCPFAAQFCEVEVDVRTGETRVLRFLGAHDSGRVMNRLTYENQVFGGIAMGIGFALTEERVLDRRATGKLVSRALHDYRIPTMLDVPAEMTCIPVEPGDAECNTTGTKGLGEPATIPAAAAVANALRDAIGARVLDAPALPFRVLDALAARGEE